VRCRRESCFFATPTRRKSASQYPVTAYWAPTYGSELRPSGPAATDGQSRNSAPSTVPGFEQSYVAQSGVQVGGARRRRCSATISSPVDDVPRAQVRRRDRRRASIRSTPQSGRHRHGVEAPAAAEAYDISAALLMPRSAEGLVVAGRCISARTRRIVVRVMPIVMRPARPRVCGAIPRARVMRAKWRSSRSSASWWPGASLRPDLLAQGSRAAK